MTDETTTGGQAAAQTKEKRQNAEQDQAISNDIGEALSLIDGIAGSEEIAALLLKKGYDTAKLQQGRDLQKAAQTAFEARQTAMGVVERAVTTLENADKAARDRYTDFRGTARTSFTGNADRVSLNLNGIVFKDRQKFIAQARTSYNAAKSAAYLSQMNTDGYDADTLQAALDELEALEQADTAQNTAAGVAQTATSNRDTAHKALMTYIKRLRGMARVALKKRPDFIAQLGL